MAIKQEEIHRLLKEGFPDADIEIKVKWVMNYMHWL